MTATMPLLQRSHGRAEVHLGPGPGGAAPRRLFQQGSAKAVLHLAATGAEVTFLNTSGGLASGDRLDLSLTLAPGTKATACTQTAERAYRADTPARVNIDLDVGEHGHLDWLPQETILYDGARLDRRTTVRLGPGATCLLVETIVLGRAAMGETLIQVDLRDRRQVLGPDDQPLWAEPLRLTENALHGPASVNGALALASVVLIAPNAADLLPGLRAILADPQVTAAASALPGRLTLRMMAPQAWPLRRHLAALLTHLRGGKSLPRAWQI